MDNLNVLLVSYEFPPVIGGEGIYTYRLAEFLSKIGCKVTVITSGQEALEEHGNFNTIRVPSSHLVPKLYSFDVQSNKIINELYKKQDIDIIHYTNDVMHLSNLKKKDIHLPIIATVHHPWAEEREFFKTQANFPEYLKYVYGKKIFYIEWLEKNICRRSDRIITVSNYTADSITERYLVPREKITVIPNAVDVERFNPDVNGGKVRKEFNLGSGPVIMYAGKLDFHKGVEYLITAFSRIVKNFVDARLVIVGDGLLRNKLGALSKNYGLGDSVVFTGRVTDEDLSSYYAASDLFVLPSLMEGFGIVLLEAMATGKACIASRAGGIRDVIVNNKTGLIVPPADAESLYQAIHAVLSDNNLLTQFGEQGRKRVLENFTLETIARQTLEVYQRTL